MRASKENAEKAIQIVKRLQQQSPTNKVYDNLMEFLKAAKAKLPTEKA